MVPFAEAVASRLLPLPTQNPPIAAVGPLALVEPLAVVVLSVLEVIALLLLQPTPANCLSGATTNLVMVMRKRVILLRALPVLRQPFRPFHLPFLLYHGRVDAFLLAAMVRRFLRGGPPPPLPPSLCLRETAEERAAVHPHGMSRRRLGLSGQKRRRRFLRHPLFNHHYHLHHR